MLSWYNFSFFSSQVTRPIDVSKVKCYGPGVDRVNPLFSKAPQEFTVDTSEAGDADLEVTVETPDRKILEPEPVCEKGDGVYTVAYTPEEEGEIQGVKNHHDVILTCKNGKIALWCARYGIMLYRIE